MGNVVQPGKVGKHRAAAWPRRENRGETRPGGEDEKAEGGGREKRGVTGGLETAFWEGFAYGKKVTRQNSAGRQYRVPRGEPCFRRPGGNSLSRQSLDVRNSEERLFGVGNKNKK